MKEKNDNITIAINTIVDVITDNQIKDVEQLYIKATNFRNDVSKMLAKELANENCSPEQYNKIAILYEDACEHLRKINIELSILRCKKQQTAITNNIIMLDKAIKWANETKNIPAIRCLENDKEMAKDALESITTKIKKLENKR